MDLIEILNNILRTKNQIRDILLENNNIARYYVTMHNRLADLYNDGYSVGFKDRYLALTGVTKKVYGPQNPLPYELDSTYYTDYTPDILLDIMKDVLNYRLHMKDELNEYLDPDIGDNFKDYPDYLNSLLDRAYNIGYEDGVKAADAAYEGTDEIGAITPSQTGNMLSFDIENSSTIVYYRLGQNGVETIYTNPIMLSYDVDVYYKGYLGLSESTETYYSFQYNSSASAPFSLPPTITQDKDYIYLSNTLNNSSIHYSIDGEQWYIYSGPIFKSANMNSITAISVRNNEYSNKIIDDITHEVDKVYIDNVLCAITDNGSNRTVVLTCATPNATIKYNINDTDIRNYMNYNGSLTISEDRFLLYTYAVDTQGHRSKLVLVYKFDLGVGDGAPQQVQFIEDGPTVTLYTVTSGAKIYYAFGSSNTFTESDNNAVALRLDGMTYITAYAALNGLSSARSYHTYNPNGGADSAKPKKPTITRNGNVIHITSSFPVYFTTNQTDPAIYGQIFNKETGYEIKEYTVIYARAVNSNGVWSDYAKASLKYNESSTGSNETGGNGVTNGTATNEPFDFNSGKWFNVTGATGLSYEGSNLLFAAEGDRFWQKSGTNNTITGLNPQIKTYFKGSISRIISFMGEATIGGDLGSILNGKTDTYDLVYKNLFTGCIGLKNASQLVVHVSEMQPYMFQNTFANCTDLVEAAFKIDVTKVSNRGMNGMFSGCTSLIGGPEFKFVEIGDYGMDSAFKYCSSLASTGSFNIISAGNYAFQSCFEGCTNLDNVELSLPTNGAAPVGVCTSMFKGCSKMSNVSIVLGYSIASSNCYNSMFYGCSALKNPIDLPASDCGDSCYAYMYYNSGLITPPIISAVNLANSCMYRMFAYCKSLTSGPELNAPSIFEKKFCYKEMFYGCENLNYLKAMFINTPSGQTADWLYGVAETGDFYGNKQATWYVQMSGPSYVPVGWNTHGAAEVGTITKIEALDGRCYITASNSDKIYYTTSSTQLLDITSEDCTILYDKANGFPLYTNPTWVYAVCENSDGARSARPTEKEIEAGFRDIIISQQGNDIYITNPENFYAVISYEIWDEGKTTRLKISNFNDNPIWTMTATVCVVAKGWVSQDTTGDPAVVTERLMEPGLSSPAITFVREYNISGDSIVSIWCEISYPSTVLDTKYIINDSSNNDYDTWNSGTYFKVLSYPEEHERATVRAVCKVAWDNSDGYRWTEPQTASTNDEGSLVLYEPILTQIAGTNKFRLTYNNQEWPNWDKVARGVTIEYMLGTGGSLIEYTEDASLPDGIVATDYNVYVRARIGNIWNSEHWPNDGTPYVMHYDPALVSFNPTPPNINYNWDDTNHRMTVYLSGTYTPPSPFSPTLWIWIEVPDDGYDYTGLRPASTDDKYRGFAQYTTTGEVINEHVMKFRVHAKCGVTASASTTTYWSEENYKDYDISVWWAWGERPSPTIEASADGLTLTITLPNNWDVVPYFKVDPRTWGIGAINTTTKYAEYKPITNGTTIGKVDTGIYRGQLDSYLASGRVWVKYTYEGGECEVPATYDYANPNIQGLVAPTIGGPEWNRDKQVYIITLTNPTNASAGVRLQYRMEPVSGKTMWAGGVVNPNKYSNWRNCGLNGDYLDEYLLNANIYARTVYAAGTEEEQIVETTTPVEFNNNRSGLILEKPQIFFEKTTSGYGIKVTSNIPYATNYFRLKENSGEWAPGALHKDKYDNWVIAYKTYNDLDADLISGTFEAYSEWGDDKTLDDLTEREYNSGRIVNYTPPTIELNTDYENEVNTITITNMASVVDFPQIKWKIDQIDWNTEVDCYPTRYKKTAGDGFVLNEGTFIKINGTTIQITIGKDIKSGNILAFATNRTSPTDTYQVGANTPITEYAFTNPLLQE